MSLFDQREQAYEAKFVHDEELRFKLLARRGQLFASWVAQQKKLSGDEAEAYVRSITESLFQPGGQHDLIDKAMADLAASGCTLTRPEVVIALEKFERIAKQEIVAEQGRD